MNLQMQKCLRLYLWIILVSSTESVRPHSAAVEKVHSSPKLNLREGVVVDTENETGNEHISGGVGVAGADGNSPVKDPSTVASGNSQSTNSTNKDKESKDADDSFWFFKYLLAKKLMDHPQYLILVQGLLVSIFCYFLVGLSVWVFARGKANSVPNPFASLSPEVNGEKDWSYFSWFWTKCFRWFFGPPPDVLNLDDAFPGLTECQRRYVCGVMMKVHRLLQKGIMEQRIEVAWKYVELTCMSVTPILVSIMGNFGEEYRTPIQCMAIGLSLVSAVCRLSPVGRGDVMTTYSLKLREICWNYWSLKGDFKVSQLEAQKESMLDSLKRQSEASAEQQSEACKEQFPDLSELRTKVAKAHGMLFLLFVEKVTAESQDGEAALSKTFSAPNASRKKATYSQDDGDKDGKDGDKSDGK